MRFTSKQVVVMVCAGAAAVILAPVGVMAATGTLVNITDPTYSSRKARVTSAGALQVETRPGVVANAVNVAHLDVQSLTPRKLAHWTGPVRLAVDEVTVAVRDFGNPVIAPTIVDLVYYTRTSGASACGLSGWSPGKTLRRFTLKTDETVQLSFDGPPLIVPTPADGQLACVALKLYQWVGDTRVDFGATVHLYQ